MMIVQPASWRHRFQLLIHNASRYSVRRCHLRQCVGHLQGLKEVNQSINRAGLYHQEKASTPSTRYFSHLPVTRAFQKYSSRLLFCVSMHSQLSSCVFPSGAYVFPACETQSLAFSPQKEQGIDHRRWNARIHSM